MLCQNLLRVTGELLPVTGENKWPGVKIFTVRCSNGGSCYRILSLSQNAATTVNKLIVKGRNLGEQYASCAVQTCCRHDRGGERPSPGYCPSWCYDTGSGPSAAPPLAAAGSAAAVGAASQTAAGTLHGKSKDMLTSHIGCCITLWRYLSAPHFVICPAVCSVTRCPCPPTPPWPSDPQRGYTLGTCTKTHLKRWAINQLLLQYNISSIYKTLRSTD